LAQAPSISDVLRDESVGVLAMMPADSSMAGIAAYRHHCPALDMELRIEIYRARFGCTEVQFCCYCGLRVDKCRGAITGRDWECETVRNLATRWLGNDAAIIQEWIEPEGQTRICCAHKRGPLLEFLLSKLRGIAQRRRDRISRALRNANREFAAVWHAEQILDAARTPYEHESVELRTGFVYAISNGTHLKIGCSTSHPALSRLRDLQVASPLELDLVGAFVGTQRDEWATQRHFYAHRIRGEWFLDVPQIRAYFNTRSWSDKNAEHSA